MALFVGESIVSSVLALVADKANSLSAEEEFARLSGVKKNIQSLACKLAQIKGVLREAEAKQISARSEAVRLWLGNLKDITYDMDDLLDECAIEAARQSQGLAQGEDRTAIVRSTKRARDGACAVSFCREMADKLQSIEERLDEIYQGSSFLGLVDLGGQPQPTEATTRRRGTTSPPAEQGSPSMVGREGKIKEIKEQLLASVDRSDESKVSVVAIVGMGGVGKTTLAQAIYTDRDLMVTCSIREWVYVGEDFDAERLMQDIINDKEARITQNLHDLQERLKVKLCERRFLIILDDVRSTNPRDWDPLWAALTCARKGSVVVVTTRNRDVARTLKGSASIHELEGLPYEQCWQIFERRAFQGVNFKHDYPRLEELGRKIVEKLKGVPLAASMIGGLLGKYLHDEKKWEWVLNSAVCMPRTQEVDLTDQILDLTYQHLPSHLKLCFAYCAIFPKDFRFYREWLIQMWMAQSYIEPQEGRRLEDVGGDYFDDLQQSCIFQEFCAGFYIMHNTIHDYTQKVFKEGRRTTEQTDCTASDQDQQVRHLSFSCGRILQVAEVDGVVSKFKNLRTLHLTVKEGLAPHLGWLAEFKYLRVLQLKGHAISEFPDSIKYLRLLKYLDFMDTGMKELPEQVACSLCVNLQTLKLGFDCSSIASVSKLVNLRHLDGNMVHISNIPQLGKLTLLQELELFHITKNADRSSIIKLKDLNNLRGSLTIEGLENVGSKEEAELANLKGKVHLEGLKLEWGPEAEYEQQQQLRDGVLVDSEVFEGLQPPPILKELGIFNNVSIQLPSWMKERQQLHLSNLVRLHLFKCSKWKHLPPLGRLPCLKELEIQRADGVKKVGHEFCGITRSNSDNSQEEVFFPSLERLRFDDMPEWEVWDVGPLEEGGPEGAHQGGALHVFFPSLCELHLLRCPRLRELPAVVRRRLTALKDISIGWCEQLASFGRLEDLLTSSSLLEDLFIRRYPKLTAATTTIGINGRGGESNYTMAATHRPWTSSSPTSSPPPWGLRTLSIDDVWLLGWFLLHSQSTKRLASLERLSIVDCEELISFTDDEEEGWRQLVSLRALDLSECGNLRCLPSAMHTLTSLQELWVESCPKIQCLPDGGLPQSSLMELWIEGCPLLEERCQEGGPDHPKIQGIPRVTISPPADWDPELDGEKVSY